MDRPQSSTRSIRHRIETLELDIEFNQRFLKNQELVGESLEAVEASIANHNNFIQNAMVTIEQNVEEVMKEGQSDHANNLKAKLDNLKFLARTRRIKLEKIYEFHRFLLKIQDTETRILEKLMIAKDEKCCHEINLKRKIQRHTIFEQNLLEELWKSVVHVNEEGDKLLNPGDESGDLRSFIEKIQERVKSLRVIWEDLLKASTLKGERLNQTQKFSEFSEECVNVSGWIHELMNIAGSQIYGIDVDHVDVLIQNFESFMRDLSESRVSVLQNMAQDIIDEGHPEPDKVRVKAQEVKGLWAELEKLAAARMDALLRAKQVHEFHQTADEIISWIGQKLAVVFSKEYKLNMHIIQTFLKSSVIENDLKSVEMQVTELNAERLKNLFPDASTHVDAKLSSTRAALQKLTQIMHQAENLQTYICKYVGLMAEVNELVAKVQSGELEETISTSEASLANHRAYLKEIDKFKGVVDDFVVEGEALIRKNTYFEAEINEKMRLLNNRWKYLNEAVQSRDALFQKNLQDTDRRLIKLALDKREEETNKEERKRVEGKWCQDLNEILEDITVRRDLFAKQSQQDILVFSRDGRAASKQQNELNPQCRSETLPLLNTQTSEQEYTDTLKNAKSTSFKEGESVSHMPSQPPISPGSRSILEPNRQSRMSQNGKSDAAEDAQYFLSDLKQPPSRSTTSSPKSPSATRGGPQSSRSSVSLPPGLGIQQSLTTSQDQNCSSENEPGLHNSSSPYPSVEISKLLALLKENGTEL